MDTNQYDMGDIDIAWCPGCGNFSILKIIKTTLAELEIAPRDAVWVTGIGQAAKIPHYFKTNFFNGLHGRALPVATGIKAANPHLTVIAESGDGCSYGEGGNHFIHTIRRNPNITQIVHNNMIYGLTKGQASPTSQPELKTPIQTKGVFLEPFNPLAVAIALNTSFVARGFSGHHEQTTEVLKQAINHHGYALVDILHPCVSFNKVNTFKWYKEHTHWLSEDYRPDDQQQAFQKALESDQMALGVLYQRSGSKTFEEIQKPHQKQPQRLFEQIIDTDKLKPLIDKKRRS